LVKDGSFESVPASALDTYFTDGGTWCVSGAVKFEAGADGFSTPYGSTYVHFYGGQSRTAPVHKRALDLTIHRNATPSRWQRGS
jgi:hypothetical protein